MAANLDAIAAVREAAFRNIKWEVQDTGLMATTAEPTLATDGISLDGRSAFAFEVIAEASPLDATVQLYGYANGGWKKLPSGEFSVDSSGTIEGTNLAGMLERVYVRVTIYVSGTLGINVGVPKP